ncbi:MAG: SAM-dependent methyltransferase [Prevotella sp.]|nr:SAM-dependent methyltransferase [Prevotella sp.]MBR6264484.1 SAM-dependent methyltransferase [Prevotella sp.]
MELSESLRKKYTKEQLSAIEAQRLAEFIAWSPVVFQASRLMVKWGILELIQDSKNGLTREEIVQETKLSNYAVKCLLEASLSIGLVIVDPETDRFSITKTGWFLLSDAATRVNLEFNHEVNYQGMFVLEEALRKGKPEGLRHFGDWPTLYEGLATMPEVAKKSWLAFDHFYSDISFPDALKVVFDDRHVETLYDVGGNTGKWALQCVDYNPDVKVTVLDLPQQIEMMKANAKGKKGADRITGFGIDFLNESAEFPKSEKGVDVIWMSQFLDCFSKEEIVSILARAQKVMTDNTRLFVMETLWDRQRFETSAFCLTMTSLYFTDIANGNSKMYNTEDMRDCINKAGMEVECIHDNLGMGHSIIVCKKSD